VLANARVYAVGAEEDVCCGGCAVGEVEGKGAGGGGGLDGFEGFGEVQSGRVDVLQ